MIRVAIIGYGKIARDQHRPVIEASPDFTFAAAVSRHEVEGADVPVFASHERLIEQAVDTIDAVAICTPPGVRYGIARDCLLAGRHVLLEKPPGVTLEEVKELERLAEERGVALFTTWHAQHNPAVLEAARRLQGETVRRMRIEWREDVRKWHPGQQWIWEPGGFGVFDPGINALSIATKVFPGPLLMRQADFVVPCNRQTPIAAELRFDSPAASGDLTAGFDWRHAEGECWQISIETGEGSMLELKDGGTRLIVDGQAHDSSGPTEYESIYRAFAELVGARRVHVDLAPLRLTAEAFLMARRTESEPFVD